MAATELTQEQWTALGYPNPSQEPQGQEKPVTFVNFYEAAAWCNRLSTIEGLESCYNLESCHGVVGAGCPDNGESACWDTADIYSCTGNVHRFADYYACPGYRLPTTAEWEYAAKARTTTHTYGGDVGFESGGSCGPQPSLDDIAWYCYNSGDVIHEVGQKLANPWGFLDILGNAFEWADYVTDGPPLDESDGHPGEDLVDPTGPPVGTSWDVRGGHYYRTGCEVTPTFQMPERPNFRWKHTSFRPVQTIFE
jgi:formylglycine-generating enzyme required for sulfatase activity